MSKLVANMSEEEREKENAKRRNKNLTSEQIEKRNSRHRIENMTSEQIEKKNANQRVENMTPEQIEKRRVSHRESQKTANMTPEQVEKRNARCRVENLTPEQIEKKNAAQRIENLTPEQIEKRRAGHRVENMTPEQIEKQRIRKRSEKALATRRTENMTPEQIEKRRARGRSPETKKVRNKRLNERKKEDLSFKLRQDISIAIYHMIKQNGGSKKNNSILKFVPWSKEELTKHIIAEFSHPNNLHNGEVWMTMNNRGVYNPNTWDDNDPSTWTWHLDHIIPHSKFYYTSMEDEEFKKCWDLSNLRPYRSKDNVLEGTRRIRHSSSNKNEGEKK